MSKSKKIRHVLGISGGKDSAALAIYLKQQGKTSRKWNTIFPILSYGDIL